MSFHVGEDLGDYKIIAIVGAGSMGQVFQVEHRLTKRKEAVKVLSAELATETQIQRFEREIAVQSRLSHPNIATAHNAICWKGCLILVMEFLEGETLEKLLSRGRLPVETGVDYIRQTLSALAYSHAQGVVHRDVSPANLIVTPGGTVKLTDFGVSKRFGDIQLTSLGDIVGNIDYMAPEQARGSSHPDRRSDLYSVGAILFEVLTGRKPFGESRRFAPLVTDSESDPPRPTDLEPCLRPQWNDVVAKALARNRERRYSNASEFLQAIEQAGPASSRKTSIVGAVKQWRFWIAKAGIAAAVMVPLLTAGSVRFWTIPPPAGITFHIPPPKPEALTPAIAPAPTRRGHVPAQRTAALRHHTNEPVPENVEESIPSQPESPTPAPNKKRFWSKLNPFKKKTHSTP
jgi:serine/threonine-protein kinase